jgi:hypothetical protein
MDAIAHLLASSTVAYFAVLTVWSALLAAAGVWLLGWLRRMEDARIRRIVREERGQPNPHRLAHGGAVTAPSKRR